MKCCTKCHRPKRDVDFPKRRGSKRSGLCKTCNSTKSRKWREEHPGYFKDRYRKLEAVRTVKRIGMLKKYGLSVEDYDRLFKAQSGACAICKTAPKPYRRLSVDHDHRTGVVRGLLCQRCNTGLGMFSDSSGLLQTASLYLKETQ